MDTLGGTSGGQYSQVTGPSLNAAALANMSQQGAIQAAQSIAGQSTQSAISALMGSYNTGMALQAPMNYAGNQAVAQENYMLGLNPYNPGAAPTAPTAPTLQSLEAGITPEQMNAYIQQNTTSNGIKAGPGQQQALLYSGVGGNPNIGMAPGSPMQNIDALGAHGYSVNEFENNTDIQGAVKSYLANQQMPQAQSTYDTANTAYQQQNKLYNQNEDLYNQYTAKGPASANDINNIVTNLPGYQFNLGQGVNAIQNAGSATGMLNSGNMLQSLDRFGQGLASNYYNQYMGNLQNIAAQGQTAANQSTAATGNTGSAAAGLQSQYGTNAANAALAAGQASASSYLSPAANQQTVGSYLGGGSSNGMQALGIGAGLLGNLL